MGQQDNELAELYVQWIEREMARREWKQAELGRRARVGPDVLSRTFKRETAPDSDTLKRLARAFGLTLRQLHIAVADGLRDAQETPAGAPTSPQERRSVGEGRSGGGAYPGDRGGPAVLADQDVPPPTTGPASAWGAVLEVLQRLPKDVQREIAVRAVRQGIEAQELQGPSLLRAMVSLCGALDDLGYPAMAREIRSEMLKAMAADLAKEKPSAEP